MTIHKFDLAIYALLFFALTGAVRAQVASNPPYVLEQTVIAAGGGQSAGGAFAFSGTIGQSVAGTRSINSGFAVTGGFWTAPPAGATSATVTIGGRVFASDNRGLRNALVTLTDTGGRTRTVMTGAFGYYQFADVPTGETVFISVLSKRYNFATQIVTVTEEISNLNFAAETNATQPATIADTESASNN